jgi:hypothetical protein
MGISQYLSKFALGVNNQGILSTEKGGTGNTSGGSTAPTVTAITYPGNDTAVNTAGGDLVTLTGTNFAVGVIVIVNGTSASVVTRVSSTVLTFIAPAQATGSYNFFVVNTDGSTAFVVPGLQYSPVPVWSTAAGSLGSPLRNISFTTTLAATGDAPVTYSLFSGTLPTGITLNSSTGVLSGTTPNVGSATTYSFTIRATDAQNQDIDRAFSMTIQTVVYFTGTIEYLLVAGGGGAYYQAGGGGGGVLAGTLSANTVAQSTPYAVTIGAGGAGNTNGQDSTIFDLTALGGGGSVSGVGRGGPFAENAPAGDSQRNAGGHGDWSAGAGGGKATNGGTGGTKAGGGGGGGGAGTTQAGNGGAGYTSSISGATLTYAGGGGGAQSQSGTSGTGGAGGGGNGGYSSAQSGTAGRGGGGGASYTSTAGSGGSGTIIIRYPDTYPVPTNVVGNSLYAVTGGYRIYGWTSSGSITF